MTTVTTNAIGVTPKTFIATKAARIMQSVSTMISKRRDIMPQWDVMSQWEEIRSKP